MKHAEWLEDISNMVKDRFKVIHGNRREENGALSLWDLHERAAG